MFISRPVWDLRGYVWRATVAFAVPSSLLTALVVVGELTADDPAPEPVAILLASLVAILLWVGWVWRRNWRFLRYVRHFQTWSGPEVVIHYEKGVERDWDFPLLAERCAEEVADLGRRFGVELRRPLVVYLFATHRAIARVFGKHYGGTALHFANAVVFADDYCPHEVLRHELVHLLAVRWNAQAPTLLQEGLATCLEQTWHGWRIDLIAQPFLDRGEPRLAALLSRKFFFSDHHRFACYMLAGSFTGFLIRRLGWDGYRRLYRTAGKVPFRRALARCSGMTLERAEAEWRSEMRTLRTLYLRLERELRT